MNYPANATEPIQEVNMTTDTSALHISVRLNQERSAIIRQITPPGRKFGEQARLLLEAAIDEQAKQLAAK